MAIDKGVTEIADSDEEPMTSSPIVDPAHATAVDKLLDANTAVKSTPGVHVPDSVASPGIDATTNLHHTDMKHKDALLPQEGPAPAPSHEVVASRSSGSGLGSSHVPAMDNSVERQPSFAEELQSGKTTAAPGGTSPQNDGLERADDTTSANDSQADHVVSDMSQTRPKNSNQDSRQNLEPLYPSDDAVHNSQAMPASISDATGTFAAGPNSLKFSALDPAGSGSMVFVDKLDIPPHHDLSEIQGQQLQMNASNCGPTAVFQNTSPFPLHPHSRNLQEEPNVRSLSPQGASPPAETTGSSLNESGASDAAPKSMCGSQHQSITGTSPTSARTCPKTPQEITLSELKAQKAALLNSLRALPAIQVLMEELAPSNAGADAGSDEPTDADVMDAANKIVKGHIKLLHEYNELKDVGQGLMGLIADQRAVRIVEVQEEFGIDAAD